MPKKTKSPKKGKRGPKEERLVIADPQAAIDVMLGKKPAGSSPNFEPLKSITPRLKQPLQHLPTPKNNPPENPSKTPLSSPCIA